MALDVSTDVSGLLIFSDSSAIGTIEPAVCPLDQACALLESF